MTSNRWAIDPYTLFIVVAAMVGGIVLAKGHYVRGAILVAIALGIYAAWRRAENRGGRHIHLALGPGAHTPPGSP